MPSLALAENLASEGSFHSARSLPPVIMLGRVSSCTPSAQRNATTEMSRRLSFTSKS